MELVVDVEERVEDVDGRSCIPVPGQERELLKCRLIWITLRQKKSVVRGFYSVVTSSLHLYYSAS